MAAPRGEQVLIRYVVAGDRDGSGERTGHHIGEPAAGRQAGQFGRGSPEAVQCVAEPGPAGQGTVGGPLLLGAVAMFASRGEVHKQHASRAQRPGEQAERRGDGVRAQMLDHGERVGHVGGGTCRRAELRWRLVGDVGQAVQHPGAGQRAAGDVYRMNLRGPAGHGGGEVPRSAAEVDDSRARRHVRRDQLVRQNLPGSPVPVSLRGQVAVEEIVRGQGQEAQGDAFANCFRRVSGEPLHPGGTEKVLVAAPCGATDQHVCRTAREPAHWHGKRVAA